MIRTINFDPHSEIHVAAIRCLAIVEFIGKPTLERSHLTIGKAAIFDAALKNPNLTQKILSRLSPDRLKGDVLRHVLYPDDSEYGDPVSTKEITVVATFLMQLNLIRIEHAEGDFHLLPVGNPRIDFSLLPSNWVSLLKAFKPLASKSLATLQKAASKDDQQYEKQHLSIHRAVDSQGDHEKVRSNVY